ncbi:MAG: hypothetical protein WB988_09360 [Candidatus Nitrosopolaris sp.]
MGTINCENNTDRFRKNSTTKLHFSKLILIRPKLFTIVLFAYSCSVYRLDQEGCDDDVSGDCTKRRISTYIYAYFKKENRGTCYSKKMEPVVKVSVFLMLWNFVALRVGHNAY